MYRTKRAVLVMFALSILLIPKEGVLAQVAEFPLKPNMAVATCDPRPTPVGAKFNVAVVDIRDPICHAPDFPTGLNTGDITNWFAPMYHNEMPNPTNNPADEWTEQNIGSIFGIALDNAPNPSIYVTATTVYGTFGSGGTGKVTRLDGTDGSISVFATLPNSGPGLGNIAFEPDNRQFYVSNFEDGRIYRLDFNGTLLDTFDPFDPDDGTTGVAPLGERIWGLQVNPVDGRLYFGVWSEHRGATGTPNRVFSVDLATDGSFLGSEELEVTPDDLGGSSQCNFTMPIADISFSANGEMLISERGMRDFSSVTLTAPHVARILQYEGGHLAWVLSPTQFEVGRLQAGCGRTNAAGGGDYTDCVEADECNPAPLVTMTADGIDCCSAPNNIYGLQITPATGGTLLNSWVVDLDADTDGQDKTNLGDVEIVRTCVAPTFGGCTFTQGYWKNHNRFRNKLSQQIPWPVDEETLLCGQSWLDNLNTPPKKGSAFYILAHQWIAAQLNVANSASTPSQVADALVEAEVLLNSCITNTSDRDRAIELADLLDDYNNGVIGPGHCDDDLVEDDSGR